MKITLSPTCDFITIDGVSCRMWDGWTSSGLRIQAAIARVGPRDESPAGMEQFAAECRADGLRPPEHPENARQEIADCPGVPADHVDVHSRRLH